MHPQMNNIASDTAAPTADQKMKILEGITGAVNELPKTSGDAALAMLKLTQKLISLSERETQALLLNDAFSLNVVQDEKENVAAKYIKAGEEFRNRLEEFRMIDKSVLARLEVLQNKLSEKMADNKKLIEEMYLRARKGTEETLFNAQEIGQDDLRIKFPEKITDGEGIQAAE